MVEQKEKIEIKLNDGALMGLADGTKVNTLAAIIELTDNAIDSGADKISIIINNDDKFISILSNETNNYLTKNDAINKLYSVGTSSKAIMKKNGVGKYNQGFKFAGPILIGENNKGTVDVDCIPIEGEPWSTTQEIDYTNEKSYKDNTVYFVPFRGIKGGFNFNVRINNIKSINNFDICELKVTLGRRYGLLIRDKKVEIKMQGSIIYEIDDLYTKMGKRVNLKEFWLKWEDNDKAAKLIASDLKCANIQEDEYCKYDTSLGKQGRTSGVNVNTRRGIKIYFHGVLICDYDADTFLAMTGISIQPSANGLRLALIINDDRLEKYFKGSNKSNFTPDKNFFSKHENSFIKDKIVDVYNTYLADHKNDVDLKTKKIYTTSILTDWLKSNKANYNIKLSEERSDVEAIRKDILSNTLTFNVCNDFFKCTKGNKETNSKLILAVIGNETDIDKAYKTFNKFKYNFESFEN